VVTYGSSANGNETSTLGAFKLKLSSVMSPTRFNELEVALAHDSKDGSAAASNIPADTGIGFTPSFRFGNPFFLAPNATERLRHFQIGNSFSLLIDNHDIKAGADWLHTNVRQLSRSFFGGRYLFDSAAG